MPFAWCTYVTASAASHTPFSPPTQVSLDDFEIMPMEEPQQAHAFHLDDLEDGAATFDPTEFDMGDFEIEIHQSCPRRSRGNTDQGECQLDPAAKAASTLINTKLADSVGACTVDIQGTIQLKGTVSNTNMYEGIQRVGFSNMRSHLQGRRKCAQQEALALIWACMWHMQVAGVRLLVAAGQSLLSISRSFDETAMRCIMSQEQHAQNMIWLLSGMQLGHLLTSADIVRLALKVSRKTLGTAHVITQRAFVRTATCAKQIYIPPLVMQRTTSSCLMAAFKAFATQIPELDPDELIQMADTLVALFLAITGDHASCNDRLRKELTQKFQRVDNIIFFMIWCLAHQLGLTLIDHIKIIGLSSPLFCLSRLMRFHEHRDGFIAHLIRVLPSHVQVVPVGRKDPVEVALSDEYFDFITRVTILRAFWIRAVNHKLEEESAAVLDAHIKAIKTHINALKKWVTIDPRKGFRTARHTCDGKQLTCSCDQTNEDWQREAMVTILDILVELFKILLFGGEIALNKWQSMAPLAATVAFTVLLFNIGPAAWLSYMRPAYTEHLEQENDRNRAKLTQFQIDQGKRLNTVTFLFRTSAI